LDLRREKAEDVEGGGAKGEWISTRSGEEAEEDDEGLARRWRDKRCRAWARSVVWIVLMRRSALGMSGVSPGVDRWTRCGADDVLVEKLHVFLSAQSVACASC
jgi:hypothetical protein